MRNSIPTSALSEFVNEVSDNPEEGLMTYGIKIDWESGTRAHLDQADAGWASQSQPALHLESG